MYDETHHQEEVAKRYRDRDALGAQGSSAAQDSASQGKCLSKTSII